MEKPVIPRTEVSYISHMESLLLSEPNIQAGCLSRMLGAVNEQLSSIPLGLVQ